MAVSRTPLLLLGCLTLHYSILSILLHYCSRSRQIPFHPSTAILLTELGKIVVSLGLVGRSGELREFVKERQRVQEAVRVREIEEEERRTLVIERERERERERAIEERDSQESFGTTSLNFEELHQTYTTPTKLHQRKPSTGLAPPRNAGLSINVDRAKSFVPSTPSLAVIPPTPAPEPSPTRIPEVSLLFPYRPPREQNEERTALDDLKDREWWSVMRSSVLGRGSSSVAVVAGLYALQNRAQYTAAANLSVPMFQLAYQLKIPSTAMCSVILLNRSLSTQQWISLFALTFGVGLVQLCSVLAQDPPSGQLEDVESYRPTDQLFGLCAVVLACLSSGFASCYFERILKIPSASSTSHSRSSSYSSSPSTSCSSPTLPSSTQQPQLPELSTLVPSKPSLWIRNIQLSVFGLVAGLPFIIYDLRESFTTMAQPKEDVLLYLGESSASRAFESFEILANGFFQGFSSPLVWLVIVFQISGGLLSALVILYADNLLKCFATSLSILLSLVASVLLFSFIITPGIAFGAALVLAATLAYTSPSTFQTMLTSPLTILFRIRR